MENFHPLSPCAASIRKRIPSLFWETTGSAGGWDKCECGFYHRQQSLSGVFLLQWECILGLHSLRGVSFLYRSASFKIAYPFMITSPSWSCLLHISSFIFSVPLHIPARVSFCVSLHIFKQQQLPSLFICVSFYTVCSSNYLKFWHSCHLAKTNCDQHRLVCGLLLHRSLLHPPAGIAAEKNWTQALDGFVCIRKINLINKHFVVYFSYW